MMFSHFSQLAGWWALLGIPLVLAIHFLQQKAKRRRTSTLFLMDALSPESNAGRTWERLRSSRAMWLQLLAVCLLAWILMQPRFVRETSSQTVAIVLDDSLSMSPFLDSARAAALSKIGESEGRAKQTRWLVTGSSDRRAALYRGDDAALARAAVARWKPERGTHDVEPLLRQTSAAVGETGISWFITNAEGRCPAGQAAVGVGRNLVNVGFVGALFQEGASRKGWRVSIKNYSSDPQHRIMTVTAGGVKGPEVALDIPAEAVVEQEIPSPGEGVECVVSLSPDVFTADDVLPLVAPQPRPLGVSVEVGGRAASFFRKLAASMPGLKLVPAAQAGVRIVSALPGVEAGTKAVNREGGKTAFLVVSTKESGKKNLLVSPVVSERDPLTEGLSLGALLSPGPLSGQAPETAQVVFWQGDKPLVWREEGSLVCNWAWEESNADRLPSVVLLVRRYLEEVRREQKGKAVVNVSLGALLDVSGADGMRVKAQPFTEEVEERVLSPYRAPSVPSFFRLRRGEEDIVSGAAFFDDVRQGDFSGCAPFVHPEPPSVRAARESMALPDPLVPLWIALIMGVLIWSWWPERRLS